MAGPFKGEQAHIQQYIEKNKEQLSRYEIDRELIKHSYIPKDIEEVWAEVYRQSQQANRHRWLRWLLRVGYWLAIGLAGIWWLEPIAIRDNWPVTLSVGTWMGIEGGIAVGLAVVLWWWTVQRNRRQRRSSDLTYRQFCLIGLLMVVGVTHWLVSGMEHSDHHHEVAAFSTATYNYHLVNKGYESYTFYRCGKVDFLCAYALGSKYEIILLGQPDRQPTQLQVDESARQVHLYDEKSQLLANISLPDYWN